MTSIQNPKSLLWGRAVSKYAKNLDSRFLNVNEHLPPLDPPLVFHAWLPSALLVRDSYPPIYEHIAAAFEGARRKGLVILGQPGIGKTAFLFYALVRALKDGIPVSWCQNRKESKWLQFDEEGTVAPYEPSAILRRLALFDQFPPSEAGFDDPGFVVQASSPKVGRYEEWAKQASARYWIMENWSLAEIRIEDEYRKNQNPEEYRIDWDGAYTPEEAFNLAGPSARRCFEPIRKKEEVDAVDSFGLRHDIEKLCKGKGKLEQIIRILTDGPESEGTYPAGFHRIFFVQPVLRDSLPSDFDTLSHEPGTVAQKLMIREIVLKEYTKVSMATSSLFTSCPSVCGFAYEAHVKNTFSNGEGSFTVVWSGSNTSSFTRPTKSSAFDPQIPFTISADTLYYPTKPNFASLDFFFVTEDKDVVMLQTTVSSKHSSKTGGIEDVIRCISDSKHDLRKSRKRSKPPKTFSYKFLFVAPYASSGKKLVDSFPKGSRVVSGHKIDVGYTEFQLGTDIDDFLKKSIEEE